MPPVSIARGGLRVSKATSTARCSRTLSITMPDSRGTKGACCSRLVDLGPQGAAHSEELDEALGLFDAPVCGLRVGGAAGVEDVRRTHGHGIHAAAAGLERDLAVDHALRRRQEGFEVGLQRVVEEAFVHQLHPLAADVGLEAVLLLA